jgi:hypothetical protein
MFIIGKRDKAIGDAIMDLIRPVTLSTRPVLHPDMASAITEARRLAALNPTQEFLCFMLIAGAQTSEPPIKVTNYPS